MTSSKTSSAPCSVQRSRSPWRKPSAGSMTPMLPVTGSTKTQAISLAVRLEGVAHGVEVVVRDRERVPHYLAGHARASPGVPSVRAPEPALERKGSAWPW